MSDDTDQYPELIERARQRLVTSGMTAGEFAALLPEHLRQPYWSMKIAEVCRAEGVNPDEGTP